jgi:tRNA (guanine37-N1)-methyltransferase
MVMLPGPLAQAIAAAKSAQAGEGVRASRVIHMTPAGAPLRHARVAAMAAQVDAGYVILAGRYEGIDERLIARDVDEEIAIGDFVVSGGELPALMLIDAIARLLPGALNDEQSAREDSFADGLLDCPHYHPAGGVRKHGGARRAVVGAPRRDSTLASGPSAETHARAASPICLRDVR